MNHHLQAVLLAVAKFPLKLTQLLIEDLQVQGVEIFLTATANQGQNCRAKVAVSLLRLAEVVIDVDVATEGESEHDVLVSMYDLSRSLEVVLHPLPFLVLFPGVLVHPSLQ